MNINLTLIVQMVVFIALIWFTMKFVWPMILDRWRSARARSPQAWPPPRRARRTWHEAEERAEEIIREARERAAQIVDQAGKRSNEMVEEAKGTASTEAQRLLAQAHEEVGAREPRVRAKACGAKSAQLAVEGASRLLGREIDARTHARAARQARGRGRAWLSGPPSRGPTRRRRSQYARRPRAPLPRGPGAATRAEIVADPRVAALVKNPALTPAPTSPSFVIDVAGAKLDADMQNFVRMLAENHRLLLLPEIAAHYEVLRPRSKTPST